MHIINCTSSKKANDIFESIPLKHSAKQHIVGLFLPSSCIQRMVPLRYRYSMIAIETSKAIPYIHVLGSIDSITIEALIDMVDCYDEFLYQQSRT